MSQTSKIIIVAIGAAIISGGSVYLWQMNKSLESPHVSVQEQNINKSTTVSSMNEGAAKYNCELSSGSFKNGACKCQIGEGQTQKMMYDKTTGFCQSDIGGPAGNAFPASIGLPYGDYSFYNDIVINNCEETGGEFLYVCNYPNGKI